MLPVRVGLVSQSPSIDFAGLVKVANALTQQLTRDFAPVWGITASVVALATADHIDPGVWPVYIVDQMPDGFSGFHQTEHNQPFATIQSGPTWSLAASHEVLEMVVDPSGNRLVAAPAVAIVDNDVQDAPGKFEYLVEVCDPSEDESCAYLIDGVLVSDFYTPSYFDPTGTAGGRYSFSGKLTRPRQVLPNGYLSWINPGTGRVQQVRHFGAPELLDLGDSASVIGPGSADRSLRSYVDRVTRPPIRLAALHPSTHAVTQRTGRQAFLASAGPQRADRYLAALGRVLGAAKPTTDPVPPARDPAAVLQDAIATFRRPGVLSVRPGLSFGPRGMGGQRAIVVTVAPEQRAALQAALPATLQGVPVELRDAGPIEQLRAARPAEYLALAAARHELRQPDFDGEQFFDGNGNPIAHPAPLALFAARSRKPEIDYTPAPDATLDAVEADVSLVLHASPDAGWAQLSDFLAGVRQSLVVGMYDFTSAHVLDAVQTALAGKQLTLTLDHPAPNPTRDQTDEETVQALQASLGQNLQNAWALTDSDRLAPVWIYPNAYHIKVAVRDDDTFWLSSGNWNNSNQPVIDLDDAAAARKIATKSDRDWHVIATSAGLARVFRAFLQHDYQVASSAAARAQASGMARRGADEPEVEVPAAVLAAGRAPHTFFPPRTVTGKVRIQPLLTPDNYTQHVLPLIASAQQRFYMQTQYIHPSGKPGDADHDALIAALADRINNHVDVRLITSQWQNDAWVEKLVDAGISADVVRRQNNVHNKGIVVDSAVVMVSSQNWSADGTLRNRDAGLIISSAEAARYFEEIFLHDWNNLAVPVAAS